MAQYLPEHCWALERVPWWEPPYILHLAREEVRLGRSQENNKVCKGHQVSRRHAVFVRCGSEDDWKTVRWSLKDEGSGQGTYVNNTRVECNQPLPLNADDLIGFGCNDAASGRTGGKETFVYRIRAPEAFLTLANEDDDLDIPDSEAPTPPPTPPIDLPDVIPPCSSSQVPVSLFPSSSASREPSIISLPSTSNKTPPVSQSSSLSDVTKEIITIDTSDEDKSRDSFLGEPSKVSGKRSHESPEQQNAKKFKDLFGCSDDEEEKTKSNSDDIVGLEPKSKDRVNSLRNYDNYLNNLSPISSDDDQSATEPPVAMDLSNKVEMIAKSVMNNIELHNSNKSNEIVSSNVTSKLPDSKVYKQYEDTNVDDDLKKLTEKLIASKKSYQDQLLGDGQMVKVKLEIKKEPMEDIINWPGVKPYTEEPECITLTDSDDEERFVNELREDISKPSHLSENIDNVSENNQDDSDDEVQIISASETSLFRAISKRIKTEYEEKSSEESDTDAVVIANDDLIAKVMEKVDCNRDSVIEALETARQLFTTLKPTIDQVLEVLVGGNDPSIDEGEEDILHLKQKQNNSFPINDDRDAEIDDLLGDSDEDHDVKSKGRNRNASGHRRKSSDEKKSKEKRSKPTSRPNLFLDDEDDFREDLPKKKNKKKTTSPEIQGRREPERSHEDQDEPSTSHGSVKPLPTFNNSYKVPKVKKPSKEDERRDMLSALKSSKSLSSTTKSNNEDVKALRKQKLAEIGMKKTKQDREVRDNNIPVGTMKSSVPKSLKLLQEFASTENLQPKRKVMKSIPKLPKPQLKSSSQKSEKAEEVEKCLNEYKATHSSDLLYKETDDGYKVPKKMSVSNVQYNDINASKQSFTEESKSGPRVPLKSILKPDGKKRTIVKIVKWKDQDGFKKLANVEFIPAANTGKKVSKANNKDELVKKKVVPPVNVTTNNDKKIITIDDIILMILRWNTNWLTEQNDPGRKEPPPVHNPWHLITVPCAFNSWQEYRRIFLPLMLQELWSTISRDYEERKNTGGSSLPVCLQEVYPDPGGQFQTVRCLAVMTELQKNSDLVSDGGLVQLDVSFITPDGRKGKPCFAFICSNQKDLLNKDDKSIGEFDSQRIKQLQAISFKANGGGFYNWLVHINLRVKLNLIPPESQLSTDKPIKMRMLSRIKPELRKFSAMLELSQSRLFSSLISPSKELISVRNMGTNLHASIATMPAMARLNSVQKEIIVSVSQACVQHQDLARVCLVQGPPGTGKSSTIAGLILQILYTSITARNPRSMARILMVAPSNAAVDQLAIKLIDLQSQIPEQMRFKLLRLGVNHSMHPSVKPFSFDLVVRQHKVALERQHKSSDSLEKDKRSKQISAENLLSDQRRAEEKGERDLAAKLKRDHREKRDQIEKINNELRKPLGGKVQKDIDRIAIEKSLAEADVILTTLSSSLTSYMEKYLVDGVGTSKSVGPLRPVSVCIMDEASQCVEPEALIPLKFGFCKLVMVGDHEQLPATVTSRKAQEYNYKQSLYQRLIQSISSVPGPSPVWRLETQYRMHPDIANWPARYFYGGKLAHAAPGLASNLSLTPFTVLHVEGKTEQTNGGYWNKVEEKVVLATIDAVKSLVGEELNIGVITFYAKQKQNIITEVMKRRISEVRVNTVDGFQGSERDVIIISCVRSGTGSSIGFLNDDQRLNVALTRAKHCLVLVGDTSALREASELWQKFVSNAESRNIVKVLDCNQCEAVMTQKIRSILK